MFVFCIIIGDDSLLPSIKDGVGDVGNFVKFEYDKFGYIFLENLSIEKESL